MQCCEIRRNLANLVFANNLKNKRYSFCFQNFHLLFFWGTPRLGTSHKKNNRTTIEKKPLAENIIFAQKKKDFLAENVIFAQQIILAEN